MPKKPAPDPQTCASCRCYVGEPGADVGHCKRYPPVPVVVADELGTTWPVVESIDVCGEYSRRLQS